MPARPLQVTCTQLTTHVVVGMRSVPKAAQTHVVVGVCGDRQVRGDRKQSRYKQMKDLEAKCTSFKLPCLVVHDLDGSLCELTVIPAVSEVVSTLFQHAADKRVSFPNLPRFRNRLTTAQCLCMLAKLLTSHEGAACFGFALGP
jgi:hypothetical protein